MGVYRNKQINTNKECGKDNENYNKENIQILEENEDLSLLEDLKSYNTIQLNQEIEISKNPYPIHKINIKNDIPICAQEFSDLTNPLYIKKICIEKVNDWNHLTEDDLCVNQILCGLTNQLFEVFIKENQVEKNNLTIKRVLFRIYGKYVQELYNPDFELEVYKNMSKHKIAPLLINTFVGGRIEEWLCGDPLSVYDLIKPSILVCIANMIGKFHTLSRKYSLPSNWEKVPCIYKRMEMWKNKVLTYNDLDKLPFDINKYVNESNKFIEFIKKYTQSKNVANDVVFCHNDLQENNIINTNKYLRLIDFEYSDYNYLSCDIANFFNETTIDYTTSVYPFFTIDKKKYISYESRKLFASKYLDTYLNNSSLSSDEKKIDMFLDAVEVQSLGTNLIWGFWSIIRAYQTKSYNEFDFLLYAKEIFKIYDEKKQYLISINIIQDY